MLYLLLLFGSEVEHINEAQPDSDCKYDSPEKQAVGGLKEA